MPETKAIRTPIKSGKYSIKKILLAIILAFLTVGVLVIGTAIIFPQIPTVVYIKWTFPEAKYKFLYKSPILRKVNTQTQIKGGIEITYGKLSFSSPWVGKPEINSTSDPVIYNYKSENKVVFLFKKAPELDNQLQPDLSKFNSDLENKLGNTTVSNPINSKYSLYKEILNANLRSLNILTPKKEAITDSVLVLYKVALETPLAGDSYNFETPTIKGFQFGDPEVSNGVELHFFDNQDNVYVVGLRGATQNEVDFLLSSVKIGG